MALEKRFYASGSQVTRSKGTSVPPWYPNFTINTWYKDTDVDVYYYYNIVDEKDLYTQYGNDTDGWASGRFFGQSMDIIEETENDDGSITATVEVQANFFRGRKNNVASAGWDVAYEVLINNVVQYSLVTNTYADFNQGQQPKIRFDVTVQPQQTSTRTSMEVRIRYPNGEAPNNTLTLGFALYNPNEPNYIPMSLRRNNQWNSLDSANGFIQRRISGNWVDKSKEQNSTSMKANQGKNRIRRNNQWLQLPKM